MVPELIEKQSSEFNVRGSWRGLGHKECCMKTLYAKRKFKDLTEQVGKCANRCQYHAFCPNTHPSP